MAKGAVPLAWYLRPRMQSYAFNYTLPGLQRPISDAMNNIDASESGLTEIMFGIYPYSDIHVDMHPLSPGRRESKDPPLCKPPAIISGFKLSKPPSLFPARDILS